MFYAIMQSVAFIDASVSDWVNLTVNCGDTLSQQSNVTDDTHLKHELYHLYHKRGLVNVFEKDWEI